MDYEKKYNEALERARNLMAMYPQDAPGYKEVFPELRESEDERVIRTLYYLVRDHDWLNGATKEEALTWLEKQKENPKSADSIPVDCVSCAKYEDRNSKYGVFPEDVIVVARACEKLEMHGYPELAHALKNVNLYTKPVDYDHEMWKNCEANFEGGKKEVIDHPEKYGLQKEQKPAWSEEDEDMLNSCISSIEEAKENRYAYKETDGDTSYDREIDWLKSLRPSWKPSEEQMKALQNAVALTACDKELARLYNQLKKL